MPFHSPMRERHQRMSLRVPSPTAVAISLLVIAADLFRPLVLQNARHVRATGAHNAAGKVEDASEPLSILDRCVCLTLPNLEEGTELSQSGRP